MKRKIKKKNFFILLISLFLLIILVFSIKNIIKWKIDGTKTDKQINEIINETIVTEETDNEEVEIIEQKEEIPKFNPYWDYIKMDMINADFNELKKINNQTKGWIKVNGTNINYPIVQAKDNKYYLTHTFDKSYNSAGWVFFDYRNKLDTTDKNMIIYAHGRYDKTMFGTLKSILTNGWLNNSSNYVVKISTEKENTLWQTFSVYKIPTTSDYIQTEFINEKEYEEFLNMLLNRSAHNFKTTVNTNDKILTLSTCYNKKTKVVLHAKLIKREKK